MKQRLNLFFPLLVLFSPLFASDNLPNSDVLARGSGRTVTATRSDGGSTSYTPSNPMPKGPEITPDYGTKAPETGGKSSFGGLLGFLWNLGKKSQRDIERDNVRNGIDRALSKAQSGIPLNSEDYAALGTADLSKARNAVATVTHIPESFTAPIASAPISTPTPTPAPAITTPTVSVPTGTSVKIGRGGITCLPPIPDSSSYSVGASDSTAGLPKLTLPTGTFKEPIILTESPFNGLGKQGPGDGIGGAITLLGGAGALATKAGTVTAVPAATAAGGAAAGGAAAGGTVVGGTAAGGAAGGTAAGGAAAGGGTVAWLTTTVLPPIAIGAAVVGVAAGVYAVLDYVTPNERNIFFKERYQQKLRNQAAKNQSQGGGSGGNSSPNPKKPDDDKNSRKVNEVQKTDALRKIKENYRYDNQTKLYKLKDNGKPIRCTRTGKPVENVKWDHTHGDIEALNGKFKHMGSLDPVTFEMYKGPEINRVEL